MRRVLLLMLIGIAAGTVCFAQGGVELNLINDSDSLGYMVGMQIGQNIMQEGVMVNLDILCAGINDGLSRLEGRLTPTDRMNILLELQSRSNALAESKDSPEKITEKLYGKISTHKPSEIKSFNDSASYAVGYNIGQDVGSQGRGINNRALLIALRSVIAKQPLLLTENDVLELSLKLKQEAVMEQGALVNNGMEGTEFLRRNAAKDGVVTLPSGLQYEVLKEGTGAKPTATDQVTVNYTGSFIDGTVFDSSAKPVTFAVKKVIRGWIEALQLMSEGSKWRLYIPANLAYGQSGYGEKIGPNKTLIFEVELVSINH